MVLGTTIFILLSSVALLVAFVKWSQQYWARMGVPQLKPNLLFGDVQPIMSGTTSLQEFFADIYKKGKAAGFKYVGIYTAWIPEFIPFEPELIKHMMTKDFAHFSSHGMYHQKKDPFIMHLFNLEGEQWRDRRSKLTPIFTSGKTKLMFETLENISKGLKGIVDKHIDADQAVNIKDTMARYTTDVIGSIALGIECDTLHNPDHPFRDIGRKALAPRMRTFFLETLFNYELLGKFGYHSVPNEVESYFTKIVKDNIDYREKTGIQRQDFMQLMMKLKNNGSLNDDEGTDQKTKYTVSMDEIISESYLFYFAGFETSSSTMTYALLELSRQPDLQQRAREEILAVLSKNDGKISYDSIMEMKYLDRVVKETLRMYPVVSVLPRKCTKDYKLPNSDIVIKKGVKVHIPIIGMHMDPEYYPKPEHFDPERFTPENIATRPDIAWIPFGEGPRQCIGMRFGMLQTKVGIVALLKDYNLTLDPSMKTPMEIANFSVMYQFKKDVMLKATRL